MYPANLAGVPDALIFFCLLFFHQGKKRRWGIRGKAPLIDSLTPHIIPHTLCFISNTHCSMKKLFLYAGLLALLVAAGCKSDGNEPIPEPKPKPTPTPTPGTTVDTTRHITPVVP
ncbi:MAG: hypothetical protein D8B51_08050, partial [Tannerella sp.]